MTSTMNSSQLSSIIRRFDVLYPRLIKNQHSHFHEQAKLTVPDQIKLCKALAKSESLAFNQKEDQETLKDLEQAVVSSLALDNLSFHDGKCGKELFLIFLYMYAQQQAQDPSKGFLSLIFELLKRAQSHISRKRKGVQNNEESKDESVIMNLEIDISIKNDDTLQSILEVIAEIMIKLVKLGEEPVITFLQSIQIQISDYLKVQQSQVLNLDLLAPTSIVYKLLEFLMQDKQLVFSVAVQKYFDQILGLTYLLFEVYKVNSKYFIITLHSSSKAEEEKSVRRSSVLFTDLLDLLVAFCCQYLKSIVKIQGSQSVQQAVDLYNCLFSSTNMEQEYFTLRERLRILNELNQIFNQIPVIVSSDYYWNMIREGLYDSDNYNRKVSMAVLKSNLKLMGVNEAMYSQYLTQSDFELMWTTFFDLYDTLESFGSHLTKAVWERTELFYAFIQKYYPRQFHPLLDFKEWLMVLYKRVQSHMNLKLRRYVQKSTLKRKYMTTQMTEYVFIEFIKSLNRGLIFKDSNIYTQFSLKNDHVNAFYERYFLNECVDVTGDVSRLFMSFAKNVSHPQLMLCTMRNVSRDYHSMRGESAADEPGFIGDEEFTLLHDMTHSYFGEQIFSSRYLCWKYIISMFSLYTKRDSSDLSLLLKLLGKMPIEFFSNQTLYKDQEGQKHAIALVNRLGLKRVTEQLIGGYLNDLFQVKALIQQMPKFGNEIDSIITGVAHLILIISLPQGKSQVSDPQQHQWLREIMRPNWESFAQILTSSYLSPEVLDSKVRYLTVLMKTLYKYGDEGLRQVLRQDFVPRTLHLVLERFENNLLIPLTKYDQVQHQPSEMSKVASLFTQMDRYIEFLQLCITACHIDMNQSNSSLEKTIKLVLQMGLKVSSLAQSQEAGWSGFLMQYVVYKGLRTITKCYAKGIKQCIARGVSNIMVSEDVLTFGRPLLQGVIEFRSIPRPRESQDELNGEQKWFLIDNKLTLTQMAQSVLLCQWKTLSHLLQVFKFDSSMTQEELMYPVVAEKAADFLNKSTRPFNTCLFRILKSTYIPVMLKRLQGDGAQAIIEEYQATCYQCWSMIKELQTEFEAATLQEFLELTFHADVMELYANSPALQQIESVSNFHQKMAKEIFEQGNKYWLIMRTAFNHLMVIFARRPHLLLGFEVFVANFAICREVRSLDSEITLYKLNHLIPQIFTKDYENMNLEEITYQGAYIRTMTLIILEELILSHKTLILSQQFSPQVIAFAQGIENLVMHLLEMNYMKKYAKAGMPYSDSHRIKVRSWQTLVVLLEFLDPLTSYTPAFRQVMTAHTGRDFIGEVNQHLWKVVALNHLPSTRTYIEIVAIKFTLMYPQLSIEDPMFIRTLLEPNIKVTVASSFLMIAGFVMTGPSVQIQLRQRLMEHMCGFLTSNGAHVRCVAQYFMNIIHNDTMMKSFIPQGMQPILEYLAKNKDCQKVIKRHEEEVVLIELVLQMRGASIVLSTPIDMNGEFLSQPFIERIKEVTSEVMSLIRNNADDVIPVKRADLWKEELDRRKAEGEFNLQVSDSSQSNYQRKILPWEQVEYDHELLKRVYEGRTRNEIIMCASLIDKIPNLAGLARTSEIMNASSLVIENRSVCDTEEFKGVSVTSEKWLPMFEVQEKDLYNYLLFQKSNGYKILGLEQTANSKMLHEYEFPSKCVLLLGKEKEGIPQKYLGILDECIEIPQFGVIRSLNVHVSGALCLWEYTKQHLPKSNSSQRE